MAGRQSSRRTLLRAQRAVAHQALTTPMADLCHDPVTETLVKSVLSQRQWNTACRRHWFNILFSDCKGKTLRHWHMERVQAFNEQPSHPDQTSVLPVPNHSELEQHWLSPSMPYSKQADILDFITRIFEVVASTPLFADPLSEDRQFLSSLSDDPTEFRSFMDPDNYRPLQANFQFRFLQKSRNKLPSVRHDTRLLRALLRLGYKLPLLRYHKAITRLSIYGDIVHPGETGYTLPFSGGRTMDLSLLEKELTTRNTDEPHQPPKQRRHDVTVAVSYRYYGKHGTGKKRLCDEDIRAIATLIETSYKCRIRFGSTINSRLRMTDLSKDGLTEV